LKTGHQDIPAGDLLTLPTVLLHFLRLRLKPGGAVKTRGGDMEQIHKRFTTEQVKALLKGYLEKNLKRKEVEDILGIGKARFFSLLKEYRSDPQGFSVEYRRASRARIPKRMGEGHSPCPASGKRANRRPHPSRNLLQLLGDKGPSGRMGHRGISSHHHQPCPGTGLLPPA